MAPVPVASEDRRPQPGRGPLPLLLLSVALTAAGTAWLIALHSASGVVEHRDLPLVWHVLRDGVLALPVVVAAVVGTVVVVRRLVTAAPVLTRAVAAGTAAGVALVASGPAHAWLFEAPHGHEAGHGHGAAAAAVGGGLPVPVHAARDLLLVLPVTLLTARLVLALLPEDRLRSSAAPVGHPVALVVLAAAPFVLAAGAPQRLLDVRPTSVALPPGLLAELATVLATASLVAAALVTVAAWCLHRGAGGRRAVRWGLPLGLVGLLSTVAYADVPEASLLRDRVSPCFDDSPVGRPFTQPMPIPPVKQGVRDGATDVYQMVEQRAETEIVPGIKTPVWAYDGVVPGPTILAEKGRPVKVTFTNDLPQGEDPSSIILEQPPSEEHHFAPSSTSVHLHGINADHLADGYPDDGDGHPHLKAPGDSRTHLYPNNDYQRPATYWYHDHSVHITSNHVYRGLAGYYLLQETPEEQAALDLPKGYGVHDIPLLLKDVMIDRASGRLIYDNCSHMGAYGDVMTVNGKQQPRFAVGNRKYRFRMLDGGDARQFMPAIRTLANAYKPADDPRANEPFQLIATDHGLVQNPETVRSVHLTPSERVEIVVDFKKYPVGTRLVMVNLLAEESDRKLFPLMAFDVDRVEADESTVPPVLRAKVQHPADSAPPSQVRTFRFGKSNGTYWSINGQIFNPLRDDARPLVNTTEDWVLDNRSGGWGHPVHLHLGRFMILKIEGRSPRPGELQGWKDSVWLGPNQRITVRHQFWNYPGRFVFHCHNGAHEDFDMMGQFNVQPDP